MHSSVYELYKNFSKGFFGTFKVLAILLGSLLSFGFLYLLLFVLGPFFSTSALESFVNTTRHFPEEPYQQYINLNSKKFGNWMKEDFSPLFNYFGKEDDTLFLQNWHEEEIVRTLKIWLNKYNKEALILYGPPGNGKSRFVANAAKHEKAILITLTPSNLFANKNHDGSYSIRLLFSTITNLAKKYPNSKFIIFIDELDRTINRDNTDLNYISAATEMISQLDAARQIKNLLVCFATNLHKDELDAAISRPGRAKLVLIDNPHSLSEIALIMNSQLKTYAKLDPSIILPANVKELITTSLENYFGTATRHEISRATYNQVLSDIIFLKKLEEENTASLASPNLDIVIDQEFIDKWVYTVKTQYSALQS